MLNRPRFTAFTAMDQSLWSSLKAPNDAKRHEGPGRSARVRPFEARQPMSRPAAETSESLAGAVAPRAEARARVGSGSGGDAVEAIAELLSIARLPPGHDPGAGCGVATAARQRWHLAIRHFGLFGGPVAAAND